MYEMAIYTSMYRLQCMGNGRSSTPYLLPFQHHLTSHHLRPHPYGLMIVGNIYYIIPKCPPPFTRPRAACWRNPPWASTIRPSLTMHTPPTTRAGLRGPTTRRIDAFADKNAGSAPGYSSNSAQSSPARAGRLWTCAIPAHPRLPTDPLRTFRPCRRAFCHHCT